MKYQELKEDIQTLKCYICGYDYNSKYCLDDFLLIKLTGQCEKCGLTQTVFNQSLNQITL